MSIIYKDSENFYERILKQLRSDYPSKKFRIKFGICNAVDIEERIGFMRWRPLDLFAMDLIKRPKIQ